MEKPIKDAVSLIIKNEEDKTLFVLRSETKDSYPLVWSLPSSFIHNDETPQDTVKRIGKDKLGVELKPIKLINEGKSDRGDFILFMHDYEAEVSSGTPSVVSDDYIEMKWEIPSVQFSTMQEMGDCCRLYKEHLEGKSSQHSS